MISELLDESISISSNMKLLDLDHRNNFLNTYDKVSHLPVRTGTGFYLFHRELIDKMNEILKPYNLTGKLYGVFFNKNALEETRVATILIEKGKDEDKYNTAVVKLMNDYKGTKLVPVLNDLNKDKVKVTDANYCYTIKYKIYSIDVTYVKKK